MIIVSHNVIQSFDLNQNVKNMHDKTYESRCIGYKYRSQVMPTGIINKQNQNMFALITHQCVIRINFHDHS